MWEEMRKRMRSIRDCEDMGFSVGIDFGCLPIWDQVEMVLSDAEITAETEDFVYKLRELHVEYDRIHWFLEQSMNMTGEDRVCALRKRGKELLEVEEEADLLLSRFAR